MSNNSNSRRSTKTVQIGSPDCLMNSADSWSIVLKMGFSNLSNAKITSCRWMCQSFFHIYDRSGERDEWSFTHACRHSCTYIYMVTGNLPWASGCKKIWQAKQPELMCPIAVYPYNKGFQFQPCLWIANNWSYFMQQFKFKYLVIRLPAIRPFWKAHPSEKKKRI